MQFFHNGLKMCLSSYSFINEQPFQINVNFQFLTIFFIFLKCFCRISKQQNAQTFKTVKNVTQKNKSRMTLKISIDIKFKKGYNIMKPDFLYLFLNLNCVAKFLYWSVGGCHGNHIKNWTPLFCTQCIHTSYPSMVNMQHFVFELRWLQFSVFSQ